MTCSTVSSNSFQNMHLQSVSVCNISAVRYLVIMPELELLLLLLLLLVIVVVVVILLLLMLLLLLLLLLLGKFCNCFDLHFTTEYIFKEIRAGIHNTLTS